jgi:hypothetical protein
MTEKGSESLPFEPAEQENIRLREENARLWQLLAVHGTPIPQLAPENPPPTKTVGTAPPVDKEERARKRIALFRMLHCLMLKKKADDYYAARALPQEGDMDQLLRYDRALQEKFDGPGRRSLNLSRGDGRPRRQRAFRFQPTSRALVQGRWTRRGVWTLSRQGQSVLIPSTKSRPAALPNARKSRSRLSREIFPSIQVWAINASPRRALRPLAIAFARSAPARCQ